MTRALASGKVKVTIQDYPHVFYDGSYDEKKPMNGFLRSPQLLLVSNLSWFTRRSHDSVFAQVYKHLFTAPSSADQGVRSARAGRVGGQSKLNRIMRVTGRDIAYAAMHVSRLIVTLGHILRQCLGSFATCAHRSSRGEVTMGA